MYEETFQFKHIALLYTEAKRATFQSLHVLHGLSRTYYIIYMYFFRMEGWNEKIDIFAP